MFDPATAPLVSVVLPTHNRAAVLPRAIASVQAQTYPAWELIVVDDASTDETPGLVRELADPRIFLLSLPIPCGHPARPRNIGWTLARGVYVAYLDDDNAWRPHHLEKLVAAAEAHPAAAGAYGGRCNHLPDGTREEVVDPRHGIDTGDGLHRRDVLSLIPEMWTEASFSNEDAEFWARLRKRHPVGLVWVPDVLSDYYIHRGNRFSTHWLSVRRYDAGFYRRNAERLDDPARCQALTDLVAGFAPQRVLDVGCGRGWVVRALRARGVSAVGVDPSPATALSAIPDLLVRTSADRLPFPDGAFDVVLCASALARIPEPFVVRSLREMARVAAGALILAINCGDPSEEGVATLRPRAWWQEQLASAGIAPHPVAMSPLLPPALAPASLLVGRPHRKREQPFLPIAAMLAQRVHPVEAARGTRLELPASHD